MYGTQLVSVLLRRTQLHYMAWYMLCLRHHGLALSRFWFQTNLGFKNSASYLETQAWKTFPYQGHALVTLYVKFLCSDWSKFDRWVRAGNVCSVLNLVYFNSWSWQSFVSTCDVLTVFFQWMYKMKYSCYQESSFIHGWFVHWFFGWEMRRLSKSELRFWMASFSFFTLLDALMHKMGSKVSSDSGLTW